MPKTENSQRRQKALQAFQKWKGHPRPCQHQSHLLNGHGKTPKSKRAMRGTTVADKTNVCHSMQIKRTAFLTNSELRPGPRAASLPSAGMPQRLLKFTWFHHRKDGIGMATCKGRDDDAQEKKKGIEARQGLLGRQEPSL